MRRLFPGAGTALNTLTVLIGSLIGIAIQSQVDPSALPTVKVALGVVTLGLGFKLFFASKNILLVAFSLVFGGLVGLALGLSDAIRQGAGNLQAQFGGDSQFSTGLILTSILFCVGPLTVLGCLEDAVEGKIDLLATKSVLDGFAAVVFGSAFGWGVFATAFVVFIFQGALTLMATRLKKVATDESLLSEVSATGGVVLVIVGMQLCEMTRDPLRLKPDNYLPALLVAPILVWVWNKWGPPLSNKFSRNTVS